MASTCTAPVSRRSRLWFWVVALSLIAFGAGVLLLAVLFFVVAWFRLDRIVLGDESVERPVLRIVTGYPGANAEVVEKVITVPLEMQLNGTEGVQSIRCVAREGQSEIFLQLAPSQDITATRQLVQERLRRALPMLPADADPPRIDAFDPDALPLAWLVLSSKKQRPLLELSVLARERVRNKLLTLPGVGEVEIVGASNGDWSVHIDPDKLRAFDLTASEVLTALRLRLRELQGPGRQNGGEKVPDLTRVVVSERAGHVIRLGDVARIEQADRTHVTARRDGIIAVALGIHKAPGFDATALRRNLREQLSPLRDLLPDDVELTALEGPVSGRASDWLLLDLELSGGMKPEDAVKVLPNVEKRLAALPERETVLTLLDPAQAGRGLSARCFVQLRSVRERSLEQIQADARKAVEDLLVMRVTVHQVVFRAGRPTRKRTFEVIVESDEADEVSRLAIGLQQALPRSGFVTDVQSDDMEPHPEVMLMPKREELLRRGVELRECFEVLAAFRGGFSVGEWEVDGRKQTITVFMGDGAGQGVDGLRGLHVRGAGGRGVALADLFEVQHAAAVPALYRYNGKRGARITGNVASGHTRQEAWAKCRELATDLGLPAGGRVVPWGDFRDRVD